MITTKLHKNPTIIGIVIAAIIHSAAILTRELSPIPAIAPLIDTIAFNGSWVYFISIALSIALNIKAIKQFFICIPERVSSKTLEGQKLILGYESMALIVLLILFPAITYFYAQVHIYFQKQHPQWHRFIEYMPFTDLVNRTMSSFPFFVTLFALVSLVCVIMPHTYLTYKYAKKSPSPLHSAITFSILLSLGITIIILGLLAASIAPWLILLLLFVGPVIFFSYIIVNIVLLKYHNRYIECE